MRHSIVWIFLGALLTLLGCGESSYLPDVSPPTAKVEPTELEKHGHVRVDNYFWLNKREDPEVVAYLEAENRYTKAIMAGSEDLQGELFDEIKGRIKKDDSSVPYELDGYYYYTRYEQKDEYPIYARKKGSLDSDEQIMLDANDLAKGHDFLSVRGVQVTPDGITMAFAVDTVGRRKYILRFRDLSKGEFLKDEIVDVTGNLTWANDNKTIFYAKQDPETLRSFQIWRHTLGSDPAKDVLVYEETDDEFSTYVSKTKSKKYIVIASAQTLSSEMRFLDADDPG